MATDRNPRFISVAVLQPELRPEAFMPNLHLLRQLVERTVADAPLDLVVLPEFFDGMLAVDRPHNHAEQSRQFLRTLAVACNVIVVGGSIAYTDASGRRFNSCFVVDRNGHEHARYDKRVLFSREADLRVSGIATGLYAIDGIRFGVLICADLWWPELARGLLERVDCLCVPCKSTVPAEGHVEYARRLWHNLALTRAMENGVPVVVSDWPNARHDFHVLVSGVRTTQTHYTSGATTICDPGHRPHLDRLQRTLLKGNPGVLRTDIDLERLNTYRAYRRSVGLLPTIDAETLRS
jgi:predicted amidohydrolase